MIDFPIGELMDEAACLYWLERHLYPSGLCCPRCGSRSYRSFRPRQVFPVTRFRGVHKAYLTCYVAYRSTELRGASEPL